MKKNLFMPYANNKGADQPALSDQHLCSLLPRCIIPKLAKSKISRRLSVYVAEQVGSKITGVQTPEDRFPHDVAHLLMQFIL